MLVKNISLKTPEENILYDEVLFQLAEKGVQGEVLRFWESYEYFIVLGRIGNAHDDVDLQASKNDDIKILRRASGGGTVLQGKGCLNYTLVLSKEKKEVHDLKRSYDYILSKIVSSLNRLGVKGKYLPISDLALRSNLKKFSGNAQKRGKKYIMHHGTILLDFDLTRISRYLKIPKDMPDYREKRSHQDFISNINVNREDVIREVMKEFDADEIDEKMNQSEKELMKEILKSRSDLPVCL